MVHVMARIVVAEGKADAFLSIAKELVAATRKEAGCLSYCLHKGVAANTFFFIEDWQDQAVLDSHSKAEHFTRLFPQIKELCTDKSVELSSPLDI